MVAVAIHHQAGQEIGLGVDQAQVAQAGEHTLPQLDRRGEPAAQKGLVHHHRLPGEEAQGDLRADAVEGGAEHLAAQIEDLHRGAVLDPRGRVGLEIAAVDPRVACTQPVGAALVDGDAIQGVSLGLR